MRVHLDVLGWLHGLTGWVGLACGVALLLLAAGTASLPETDTGAAVMWLLLVTGAGAAAAGGLMIGTGRALARRRRGGRLVALLLAVPNLCVLPFGTALAIYSLWALLNDDARVAFGRPPRRHPRPVG